MTPILYIIMRNDMNSLNPGKACAQASHATSEFESSMSYTQVQKKNSEILEMYRDWKENRNFGTTIVLESDINEIEDIVSDIRSYKKTSSFMGQKDNLYTGMVFDPTYPIKDGEVTHLIPLHTCGWIFGHKEELEEIIGHLELMK